MKEILDNHRAHLTDAEKHALWGTVRDELRRPRTPWARTRRPAFALAGAAAAIILTVVTLSQKGTNLEAPEPTREQASSSLPSSGPADAPDKLSVGAEQGSGEISAPIGRREARLGKEADEGGATTLPTPPTEMTGVTQLESRYESTLDPTAGIAERANERPEAPAPDPRRGDLVDVGSTKTATVFSTKPEAAPLEAKDDGRGLAGGVPGGVVGGVLGGVASREKSARLVSQEPLRGDGGRVRPEPGLRVFPPTDESERPAAVGGTDPVNGEPFDSMFFRHAGVNPFVDPREDPLATFAIDVDTASYSLARAYLRRGELPPPEAIRVEEFVNALPHDYAPPRDRGGEATRRGKAFAIHLEAAPAPFGSDLVLLRVGLKGREIAERERKPAVLTFVVDVSGSMERENRLELVKRALHLLLDELRPEDRVGLVVYGSTARVVLPHVSLRERSRIERAIDGLVPEGSTNAAAGLRQGYALADEAFRPGWINRILLCSDGVANTGSTAAEEILARIGSEARRGIELSTIGFGMGNYNDVLMEKLADQGDGSYHYVDDLDEAHRVFVEGLTGTLQSIARQVKVQVAFDPETVRRYRLLGYENRDVADRDFRNDRIDAGEVGAGHEVTALFEVSLEDAASGEGLAEVRLRYEEPEGGRVVEMATAIGLDDVARRFDATSASFQLDAAVAEFAEILRGSYWAREGSLAEVARVARGAAREGTDPEATQEFVRLVEKARSLWPGSPLPEEE